MHSMLTEPVKKSTPEKLIEVAIDLFSVHGFKGTSIRDIGRLTGMTISNIYYHFGNKEGLFLAILEHSSKRLVDKLREAFESETDPVRRFEHLIRTHLGMAKEHSKEAKIFFSSGEYLSPEGEDVNRQFQLDILNLYQTALRALRESGHLHYDNLTILSLNILGVVNWHLRWYRPDGGLTLAQTVEEVVNFVLHGVFGTFTEKTP